MTDSEFHELLNLYLDHEIQEGDASRLEAEVQKNAQRRAMYTQYCRMQKACSMLSEEFVEQAASSDTRNISGFVPERRKWWASSYAAASLITVAACVAFVWIIRKPVYPARTNVAAVAAGSSQSVATAAMEQMAQTSTSSLRTVANPMHRSDMQSVIAPYSFRDGGAATTTLDPRLNWLQNVQLVSLPATRQEPLHFGTKALAQPPTQSFGPLPPAATELNALQFQK